MKDNFIEGVSELGVPILDDINTGISAGVTIAPSSMTFQNQSRCDSKTAYVEGIINRPNLHLATQQTVVRIGISKTNITRTCLPRLGRLKRADGVEVSI
jgi:hypothetical protein